MKALTFWKAVTVDHANLIESLFSVLDERRIRYCVVGGQAVNAYVEPLVSLDLDLAVAADQMEAAEAALRERFHLERFPHSLNISAPESKLRVQIQTDPRYFGFVERASPRDVLGLTLPVASLEDVLQGKIWAAQDASRRPSKRKKDLLDIERILEAYPPLRDRIPMEILDRLG